VYLVGAVLLNCNLINLNKKSLTRIICVFERTNVLRALRGQQRLGAFCNVVLERMSGSNSAELRVL
jgi:hypothetical protein